MAKLVGCMACGNTVSSDAAACPKCGQPMPARSRGSTNLKALSIMIGLGVAAIGSCSLLASVQESNQRATTEDTQRLLTLRMKQEAEVGKSKCERERETYVGKYKELWTAGQYWDAARAIGTCDVALKDEELRKLIALAEVKDYTLRAGNPKLGVSDRLIAINGLEKHYPDSLGDLGALKAKLEAKAEQDAAAARRKAEAEEKARRKKEGVAIGMTAEQVLQSSWGRPDHVNRSTYSWGTTEQWVYGGRNYLYFKNGVLESIQN